MFFFFFFLLAAHCLYWTSTKGGGTTCCCWNSKEGHGAESAWPPASSPAPAPAYCTSGSKSCTTIFNGMKYFFFFFFNRTEVRVQFILEEVQKVTRNKEKARMLWDAGWHLLIVTPLVQWGQLLSTDWSVWISQLWFKSHGQGKMKNVTCVLSLFHLWALLLDCPLSL